MKRWRRIIAVLLTMVMVWPARIVHGASYNYNASAAIAYAEAHWNDGVGLCAEFVSKCVQAGGIGISTKTVTISCFDAISAATGIQGQWLTLTSGGYAMYSQNSDKLAKGDVVISWCEGHGHLYRPHIMICGGYDASGYATFYAHNSARHNARIPASSGRCGVCGRANGQLRAKVLHLSGNDPHGCLDGVSAGNGTINVRGWAFDRDSLASSLQIRVYVGNTLVGTGDANQTRTDVNQSYSGVGNNHGFNFTLPVSAIGNQTVSVYAINVGQGNNKLLGSQTVNIKPVAGKQSISDGEYYIASAINNNYYAITENTTTSGANVYLSTKKQKYHFEYQGNGYYKIIAGDNGKVFDVYGAGEANGTNLQLWDSWGQDSTLWVVQQESDGNYSFISKTNGLHMEVCGTNAYEGCNIDVYQGNGAANTRWKLIKYEPEIKVSSIQVNQTSLDLEREENVFLNPVVIPANATNGKLTWESENSSVAVVDSTGTVSARQVGETIVWGKATDGSGVKVKIAVRVHSKQETITKPATVKNLKAELVAKKTVKLTWSAQENVNGYIVYAVKGMRYVYCGRTTNATYTDTNAAEGVYNIYAVVAYRQTQKGELVRGNIGAVTSVKGSCKKVTKLNASSVKDGVKISWSKSFGADGYLIYGINRDGKYHYVGMTGSNSFTDKHASKVDYNFYWVFPYHRNTSRKLIVGQICSKYVYGKAK